MITGKKALLHCKADINDDLRSFRTCLRWLCLDQSNRLMAILSWTIFGVLAIVVPALSHYMLACPVCDSDHRQPYDSIVQLSLSSIATLSYVCLTRCIRKYGLRKLLCLDKLCDESEKVRLGYTEHLSVCSLSPYTPATSKLTQF